MSEYTVTIKNDDEGFYGSASSQEIESIDHDASLAAYETAIDEAIRKIYTPSELEIEHEYGPYAGRSIWVRGDDPSEEENIQDVICEIIDEVYNAGMFWVTK